MMFMHSVRCVALVWVSCGISTHVIATTPETKVRELTTGTEASLRGVAVAGEKEAWVSGSAGTVMRTTDAGKSWFRVPVPDSDELDFRDVEIPASGTVLLMAAGLLVQILDMSLLVGFWL